MQLTALIVDDEPLAREGLRALLAKDAEVSAIREARDGREAVAAIREWRPDLVLLDVQMPEMDGFSVVRAVGAALMPAVVFVTAHDMYAVHAFEINALDYLLKPIIEERFVQAMARAKERMGANTGDANQQILRLLETVALPQKYVKRLAVWSSGKTTFLDVEEVDWIRAAENYVELHVGRTSHMLHVTMSALERSLDPEAFIRIHRSVIVNVAQVRHVESGAHGDFLVTLRDGLRLQSGRTYAERIRALLTNQF
jgi:two-component system LytT family response regulator